MLIFEINQIMFFILFIYSIKLIKQERCESITYLSKQHKRVCSRNFLGEARPMQACHPQILADQLALYQPGGAIMPTTLLLAPLDFQTFLRS